MLFVQKEFISHSGLSLTWKIDCDALANTDIEVCAWLIAQHVAFCEVLGIPKGGMRLAETLKKYKTKSSTILLVDDVFTTGKSMEEARKKINNDCRGAVIFARQQTPAWILPLFLCCI
jgi:hypothetical protein